MYDPCWKEKLYAPQHGEKKNLKERKERKQECLTIRDFVLMCRSRAGRARSDTILHGMMHTCCSAIQTYVVFTRKICGTHSVQKERKTGLLHACKTYREKNHELCVYIEQY